MKISFERWCFLGAVYVWYFLLNHGYKTFVFPTFEYFGFYLSILDANFLIAYIFVGVASFFVRLTRRPSDFFILLFFGLFIVPLCSYYAMAEQNTIYFISMMSGFILVSLAAYFYHNVNSGLIRSFVENRKVRQYRASGVAVYLCWGLVLVSIIRFLTTVGFGGFNLDLELVYEFRGTTISSAYTGVFGYLIGWASKVAVLGLVVHYILTKNVAWALIALFTAFVFYGFTQSKQALFDVFLVVGLIYICKVKYFQIVFLVVLAASAFSVLVYSSVMEDVYFASILFRRAFFTPTFLSFNYFEYFSNNPLVYLSNSIFSFAIDNPYEGITMSKVLGAYLDRPEMGANTSFLASSFMHFSYVGVIIFAVITGFILSMIDKLSANRMSLAHVAGFCVSPLLSLFVNSAFFTSLLTHGILFSMLIIALYAAPANSMPGSARQLRNRGR